MTKKRVGILISGRGSNMVTLIEAASKKTYPAEIVLVISNRPDAAGLDTARKHGIEAIAIDHEDFAEREAFEDALDEALRAAGVEIVCNAGFMRLLTNHFVQKWLNRQINIHPSLLPAYKGLNSHERALTDGVRIAGCTVHFVRTEMDSGPIIAQAAVPVCEDDTVESLAARVLGAEHKLYPLALGLVAAGLVRVVGDRVAFEGNAKDAVAAAAQKSLQTPALIWPPLNAARRRK